MKKLISFLVVFILMFSMTFSVYGTTSSVPVSLSINNHYIIMDSQPFILNNTTYVPIRFIVQSLGIDRIEWNGEEQSVLIVDGEKTIQLTINETEAYVNGELYLLESPPIIANKRTMVPIRFIAENLDCDVKWDGLTYSVVIEKENLVVDASNIMDVNYNQEDILWLSRIVHVEGLNLSLEGKLAIANVVLNRRDSIAFPNTINGVIFDDAYCIQFPPAHRSSFPNLVPAKEAILAAKLALNGQNNISTCLYFNCSPFNWKSNDLYKVIEGEYFYY